MNFHPLFKILKKNQNFTDRRTDNVKTVGGGGGGKGGIKIKEEKSLHREI